MHHHQESKKHENLVFVDETSIETGFRLIAEQLFAKERRLIESRLPPDHFSAAVGFCRGKPVQIYSPYSIPPGSLRKRWMNVFYEVMYTSKGTSRSYAMNVFLIHTSKQFFFISLAASWMPREI